MFVLNFFNVQIAMEINVKESHEEPFCVWFFYKVYYDKMFIFSESGFKLSVVKSDERRFES